MSALRQIVAVVDMNMRALRSRIVASSVIVIGMAAAVAVALAIFSMAAGLQDMLLKTTAPDRMVVLGQGAAGGGGGGATVPRDALMAVADLPGIMKGPDGKPLVAGDVAMNYVTRKKQSGTDVSVGFRGTSPNLLAMRPELQLVEGRMFTPGKREAIAGRGAVDRFENIALGSEIILADGPWKIVGIVADSSNSLFNFGLMADSDTLATAVRRNAFINLYVRLEEGTRAAQDRFVAAVKANPSLNVDVESEYDYRARQMANTTHFYAFLAYGVGAIMGLGVILAALNTMYSAVAARTTEIATLRAIGFGAMPVVVSVMVEALALSMVGAVVGTAVALLGFGGREQSFQNIAIGLAVTPAMMAVAIGLALAVGFFGALFPALHAARLPVATALQGR